LSHGISAGRIRTVRPPLARRSTEVTDIFTTALPCALLLRMAIGKGRWGTGEIGVSDANASASLRKNRSPRHDGPREVASTVRDAKGGIRTRFFPGTK